MKTSRDAKVRKVDLQLAVAAIAAIALVIVEVNTTMLQNARVALFVAVKPVVEIAQVPNLIGNALERGFAEREVLRERLLAVNQENRDLRQRVIELENQELRSRWLSELLEVREKIEYPVATANLVSVQLLPGAHKVVLDRGSKQQVFVGQPVLDQHGLIGQVTEVTRTDSAVTLITDSSHSVPVRIRRTGQLAIVHGLGLRNHLLVSGVRSSQDVVVGDVLITSGLGNRFPAGYPVAEIDSVERNLSSAFAEISATPLASIDPDFEVLMVWNDSSSALDALSTLSSNESSGN